MSVGSFSAFLDAARGMMGMGGRAEMLRARVGATGEELSRPMEDFECYALCQACGCLNDNAEECFSCRKTYMIDLKNSVHARYIQESEEFDRRVVPSGLIWLTRLCSLGFFILFTIVWVFLAGAVNDANLIVSLFGKVPYIVESLLGFVLWGFLFLISPFCLIPGVALYLGKLLRKPFSRWVHRLKARRNPPPALRWSAVFSPPKRIQATTPTAVGTAQATTLLKAPFSGRPCVAYQLRVYLEEPLATFDRITVLDERKTAPDFQIDAQSFDGHDTLPALTEVPAPAQGPLLDEVQRQQFLRQRGLFWDEGTYIWKESIIAPGDHVSLQSLASTDPQDQRLLLQNA